MKTVNDKQVKMLIEIFKEIGEALEYVPDNSPASYAIAVPYASMCTFLTDELHCTEKQLGIKFLKKG